MKAATVILLVLHYIQWISIHAAREGGDNNKLAYLAIRGISIHAAREGGDFVAEKGYKPNQHFNPRRP